MSKKSTSRTLRRVTGASLSGALAAGMMLGATSAQAADPVVEVSGGDIAPNASTYAGWHQGADNASGRYGVSSEGLKLIGQSQVLRGYDDNNALGLDDDGVNADIHDLVGAKYDVASGEAFFQVPLFIDDDGARSTPGKFTTIRPSAAATADTTISADDQWVASRAVPGVPANTPVPLEQIIDGIADRDYKTIGFGVYTDTGETATVKSISFSGKTYDFVADEVQTSTVKNADVKDVEEDNYADWHQGYDDATARQQVNADGLVLAGKSQVIKGFDNNSSTLDAVNASLASVLDDASYTVDKGKAHFQIPLFSDKVADSGFATLRAEGTETGEHNLDELQWQSSKDIGSIPANTEASLADIVVALGTYKVIGYGVLTVPGESAVVSNITFDDKSYNFEDVAAAPTAETVKTIAPDESTYAGWHQGGNGPATIADSTLKLGANKSQVLNGFDDNVNGDLDATGGDNGDLRELLRTASYNVTSGTVHFQVPLFSENVAGSFTTLRPTAPAEVGDNSFNIADEWTSSKAIDGVVAANGSAPLGDILSGLGGYKAIAFGVFSDAGGNGGVSSITWDGVKYDFVTSVPVAEDVVGDTIEGDAVAVTLLGEDADGDTLTYTSEDPDNGTVSIDGAKLTYQRSGDFTGVDTFEYTVSDGRGGEDTAEVEITVNENNKPVASSLTKSMRAGETGTFRLDAEDSDGDVVTYSLVDAPAGATVEGDVLTYKPASNFVGSVAFAYRATDARGGSDTNLVRLTVAKATSKTTFTLSPTKTPITTRSRPKANIAIVTTGRVNQARVYVYDGSTKVGTGVLASNGKVVVTFTKKLKKGTHKIKVKFNGTSSVVGSQKTINLKITK